MIEQLNGKNPNDVSAKIINASFSWKMHSQTVGDTLNWLPMFMERNRLYLLVIYTAFLETYLKEVTFFYMASSEYLSNPGEVSQPLKLTKVGEALASPILKSSTVPDMIKYASELYDINFGNNLI